MQTPMASPYDQFTCATQVAQGIDLAGKRVLITGATAGIGLETARVLAHQGAKVTLLGRDAKAGKLLTRSLQVATGNPHIDMLELDLSSLASVQSLVDHLLETETCVDLLINNAGVMAKPLERCENGIESQLMINYVSHLLLSVSLMPLLLKSADPRVVTLTSLGHHMSAVHLDDLNFDRRDYHKWKAYGQSKTADSLLAVYLHQRWGAEGLISTAVHPGAIMGTKLGRFLSEEEQQVAMLSSKDTEKTLQQGAATTVWAALSPMLVGQGGTYLEDCNVAVVVEKTNFRSGVLPYALCPGTAEQLVHQVESLTGLSLG